MRAARFGRRDAGGMGDSTGGAAESLDLEQLERCVEAGTHRQIRNLKVKCLGNRLLVTGSSRTYYAKQLATHAILAVLPGAALQNEIAVALA